MFLEKRTVNVQQMDLHLLVMVARAFLPPAGLTPVATCTGLVERARRYDSGVCSTGGPSPRGVLRHLLLGRRGYIVSGSPISKAKMYIPPTGCGKVNASRPRQSRGRRATSPGTHLIQVGLPGFCTTSKLDCNWSSFIAVAYPIEGSANFTESLEKICLQLLLHSRRLTPDLPYHTT